MVTPGIVVPPLHGQVLGAAVELGASHPGRLYPGEVGRVSALQPMEVSVPGTPGPREAWVTAESQHARDTWAREVWVTAGVQGGKDSWAGEMWVTAGVQRARDTWAGKSMGDRWGPACQEHLDHGKCG